MAGILGPTASDAAMFPGLNARVHNRCCRGPGAGIECSLDSVLQKVCRLQTLLTSHKCHTSMSSDTRVSHLTSMCSDDLPSRWVASYLCLTSLKCHSHDDLQHFRRTFWGKPDIPCWREASHRPPPPQARARDVDDRAAGLRAADQLRLPPHAEGAYSMQKLLAEGISPLVRMI